MKKFSLGNNNERNNFATTENRDIRIALERYRIALLACFCDAREKWP